MDTMEKSPESAIDSVLEGTRGTVLANKTNFVKVSDNEVAILVLKGQTETV